MGLYDLYQDLYITDTAIILNGTSSLLFPAVTLCNQNRVNCDRVASQLQEIDPVSDNQTFTILQWIQTNACTESASGRPGHQTRRKRQSPGGGPGLGLGPGDSMGPPGETPVYLESEYSFLAEFMTLNETMRRLIGHQFESFIKSCTFRGKDCLNARSELRRVTILILFFLSYFEKETSPGFGNCFSFNSNVSGNNENAWSSSLPGSVLGLNIVLNIEQFQYLKQGLTPSAGARVTIHDTEVRPLVDEYGMNVEPNKATSFAIVKVRSVLVLFIRET